MATCEELAAQLTAAQTQLAQANSSLNSTNLSIAASSLGILGSDPGAIVPLTAGNIAIRMAQLYAQQPPNYALLAQYVTLSGFLALWASTTAQIAFIQLTITGIQQSQANQNC
jgi:hypothetical protein